MSAIDPMEYRTTLGTYPTGVVIVSADAADGPVGLAIGSFTSVSLDPPLVGFLPGKASTTWPKIEAAGSFCVNILAADQLSVCWAFSAKDGDRYGSLTHRTEVTGAPVIDGVLSWIDCTLEAVADAGDHWWVTGRVQSMKIERDDVGALLFYRGTYGDFTVFPPS